MITLQQLDASNRAAFQKTLQEPWQHHTWPEHLAADIIQWRYFDERPEGSVTWLAMDENECVGILDSMLRPYYLDGERIEVRETADWYVHPNYRNQWVGLKLLMHLRRYPEPVFTMGGSEINVQILSKIPGWVSLPAATSFMLPLNARGLAANWVRHTAWTQERYTKLIPSFLPVKRWHRIKPPSNKRVRMTVLDGNDVVSLPLPPADGLTQLFDHQQWRTMLRMPYDMAEPVAVRFDLDECWGGFALAQVENTPSGRDGKIMYLQARDPALLPWIISVTTQLLAKRGAGFVRACVSTPEKCDAMREVGYLTNKSVSCHWWQRAAVPDQIDVGYLRIDDQIPFRAMKSRAVRKTCLTD